MTGRVASCACGQLSLTTNGEPFRVSICSCTQCQKRTGSIYGVGAYFRAECVETIQGSVKTFTRSSDAVRWLTFNFCPDCGTTLFWEMELPGIIGVAVGTFPDRSFPEPEVAVWTQHCFDWAPLPDGTPVYARAQEL
jgi:hypothetical protein